jgi:pimeloyl-ACP methyl ester carboxylesterase
MPDVAVGPDLTVHYREDDFTDPWTESETVVFLHGLAESGEVWYAWVPHLARRYRVLRPDLRGFGGSTIPPHPASFPWGPAVWAADLVAFLDALGVDAAHVVAARAGSTAALTVAAEHPDRVLSLTLVSGFARGGDLKGLTPGADAERIPVASGPEAIAELGLAEYVRRTNRSRIGSDAPDELLAWSAELQARSDPRVVGAVMRAASGLDLSELLPRIAAPTLVIAASDSVVQSIEATRDWQSRIADSELRPLPGDSPHLALLRPDECAAHLLDFLSRARART